MYVSIFRFLPFIQRQAELATNLVAPGGKVLIKFVDCFCAETVAVISALTNCFERLTIVKPVTSRPSNSERYLILSGRNEAPYVESSLVSASLCNFIESVNFKLVKRQQESIRRLVHRQPTPTNNIPVQKWKIPRLPKTINVLERLSTRSRLVSTIDFGVIFQAGGDFFNCIDSRVYSQHNGQLYYFARGEWIKCQGPALPKNTIVWASLQTTFCIIDAIYLCRDFVAFDRFEERRLACRQFAQVFGFEFAPGVNRHTGNIGIASRNSFFEMYRSRFEKK